MQAVNDCAHAGIGQCPVWRVDAFACVRLISVSIVRAPVRARGEDLGSTFFD